MQAGAMQERVCCHFETSCVEAFLRLVEEAAHVPCKDSLLHNLKAEPYSGSAFELLSPRASFNAMGGRDNGDSRCVLVTDIVDRQTRSEPLENIPVYVR